MPTLSRYLRIREPEDYEAMVNKLPQDVSARNEAAARGQLERYFRSLWQTRFGVEADDATVHALLTGDSIKAQRQAEELVFTAEPTEIARWTRRGIVYNVEVSITTGRIVRWLGRAL